MLTTTTTRFGIILTRDFTNKPLLNLSPYSHRHVVSLDERSVQSPGMFDLISSNADQVVKLAFAIASRDSSQQTTNVQPALPGPTELSRSSFNEAYKSPRHA